MDSNLLYDKYFLLREKHTKTGVDPKTRTAEQKAAKEAKRAENNAKANPKAAQPAPQPAEEPKPQTPPAEEPQAEEQGQTKESPPEETDNQSTTAATENPPEENAEGTEEEQPTDEKITKQNEQLNSVLKTVANVVDVKSFKQAKTGGGKSALSMFPKQWQILNQNYPNFASQFLTGETSKEDIDNIVAKLKQGASPTPNSSSTQ